jgi:hypothetical protein
MTTLEYYDNKDLKRKAQSKIKPIFVCYIQFKSDKQIKNIRASLEKELINDYHILVVSSENYIDVKFELFNSELNGKDFEELKKMLKLLLV